MYIYYITYLPFLSSGQSRGSIPVRCHLGSVFVIPLYLHMLHFPPLPPKTLPTSLMPYPYPLPFPQSPFQLSALRAPV